MAGSTFCNANGSCPRTFAQQPLPADDRWLAVVAQTPMHLYDLGEWLLRYFEAGNLRCSEVVNLSGDREALLAIFDADGNSIAYFGDPTLPKASIVAFKPTQQAHH